VITYADRAKARRAMTENDSDSLEIGIARAISEERAVWRDLGYNQVPELNAALARIAELEDEVARLRAALGQSDVARYRVTFGLTEQEAMVFGAVLAGRAVERVRLLALFENLEHADPKHHLRQVTYTTRGKLRRHGIELEGVGYVAVTISAEHARRAEELLRAAWEGD
jgi:uncharacterized small protein (DUF1192 family)